MKLCKGLKLVLDGNDIAQKEITEFINKYKNYEISQGVINYSFFKLLEKKSYKFLFVSFSNYLSQVIKVQKEKIDLFIGNLKLTFKKKLSSKLLIKTKNMSDITIEMYLCKGVEF